MHLYVQLYSMYFSAYTNVIGIVLYIPKLSLEYMISLLLYITYLDTRWISLLCILCFSVLYTNRLLYSISMICVLMFYAYSIVP